MNTTSKQELKHGSRWENHRSVKSPGTSASIKCEKGCSFFHGKCVVHRQFLPRGQTVNGQLYLRVMKRLTEAERRRRSGGGEPRPGGCNTIAHLPTRRSSPVSFCRNTRRQSSAHRHALHIWLLHTSFDPEADIDSEISPISGNRTHGRKVATGPIRSPSKCIP
jgi:hypothetical protein